jgi:purine-nucleoside phosphorylase
MSLHIGAQKGEIAETVLMPGDPLRAKHVAEKFLTDAKCHNQIRGMLGYTGYYKGKKVSIQGSGMGMPSMSIYVNELIREFDVKNIIRIGTSGSYKAHVKVKDIVIAMAACTNSAMNKLRFEGMDFAPIANFDLLMNAYNTAKKLGIDVHIGNVLTSDTFYEDKPDMYKKWADYGVLSVEMETSALYTLAAKYQINALSILTISDSLVTHEETTAEERQNSFDDMVKIALESIL